MTKILGTGLAAFYLSALCCAQMPAAVTVPSIKTEVTPDSFMGNSIGHFLVTNESKVPIVALHFVYGCGLKQWYIFDPLVEVLMHPPIGYLETYTPNFGGADIWNCPGGVDAAVFADGHNEGDPAKVAEIYSSRRAVDEGIAFVLPLVSAVVESEAEQPHSLVA